MARIQQGVTAPLTIDVGSDLRTATAIYVIFVKGDFRLEKALSDITFDGNKLKVSFTEEEALSIPLHNVKVQVVAVVDGQRIQSDIVECDVSATLKESEVLV